MQLYRNLSTASDVLAAYLFEDEQNSFQAVPTENHIFLFVIDAMLGGLYPGEKIPVEAQVADLLVDNGWFDGRFIDYIIREEISGLPEKKTIRLSEKFYAENLYQQA